MRGAIHGIWFTEPGGKLHPEILPNLTKIAGDAAKEDFYIMLWTNTSEIDPQEIAQLQAAHIIVSDHKACQKSPLYKYFEYFLNKGIQGDKAAFGLASDIFRMAILDFTAADKYFIYFDVNDMFMSNLAIDLHNLDQEMSDNSFGFAFPAKPIADGARILETRNDLLIARKDLNPEFFKKYLEAYWLNLKRTYKTYKKPDNDQDAKLFANIISNETSPLFFVLQIEPNLPIKVLAQFGDYQEYIQVVNSGTYIKYVRNSTHSSTWLQSKQAHSAQEELDLNQKYLDILNASQQQAIARLNAKQYNYLYLGVGGVAILLCLCAVWLFLRKRSRSIAFKN